MSFWCLFLDPHLTTHHSNIDVQTIVVVELGTSTLWVVASKEMWKSTPWKLLGLEELWNLLHTKEVLRFTFCFCKQCSSFIQENCNRSFGQIRSGLSMSAFSLWKHWHIHFAILLSVSSHWHCLKRIFFALLQSVYLFLFWIFDFHLSFKLDVVRAGERLSAVLGISLYALPSPFVS